MSWRTAKDASKRERARFLCISIVGYLAPVSLTLMLSEVTLSLLCCHDSVAHDAISFHFLLCSEA